MRTIGNILWFIFGGLLGGLAWVFAGCIWCITIIGIQVDRKQFVQRNIKKEFSKFEKYKDAIPHGGCVF